MKKKTRQVKIKARKKPRMRCRSCGGSGRIEDDEYLPMRTCMDCQGKGYYYAKSKALALVRPTK